MQKIELFLNTSMLAPKPNEPLNTGLQICDQLIGINEVMHILSVKRTSLYKGMKNGVFPEPMRFSQRMVRWRLSDVMAVVGQSKPFIPNLLAANDSRAVSHANATADNSQPTQGSSKNLQSPTLEKLQERRRELLANATPSNSRAQIPVRRRIPKKG